MMACRVSRTGQNCQPGNWFMPCARLETGWEAFGRKSALGLPQHFRKTFKGARLGRYKRCKPTKGPGAPDRAIRMEEKAPAFHAGPRCAHRLHAVLFRQRRARTL